MMEFQERRKMRDKKRIPKILSLIEEIWQNYPDQRFGQLLINIGIAKDDFRCWNLEDDILEEYLKSKKGKI
jgi:hypothetical protein